MMDTANISYVSYELRTYSVLYRVQLWYMCPGACNQHIGQGHFVATPVIIKFSNVYESYPAETNDEIVDLLWWRHQMEIFFRVTGLLFGEFTGNRWFPLTKAGDVELLCFLWSAPEPTVEQTMGTPVISDAIALSISWLYYQKLNNIYPWVYLMGVFWLLSFLSDACFWPQNLHITLSVFRRNENDDN